MASFGNPPEVDVDNVPLVLDQHDIDFIKMKELNQANRHYRKCLAGKCPPVVDRRVGLVKKTKRFVSKKLQDKKLSNIWVALGRAHRFKIMEAKLLEIDTKITVASSKPYQMERENDFKIIERTVKEIEDLTLAIAKARSEIVHIKSQVERVGLKRTELSHETESEGKKWTIVKLLRTSKLFVLDKFQEHLIKARRQLEIYEGRVQTSRQHECIVTQENYKLRDLIQNMLCDRAVFNFYWGKIVHNLRDRRKFLLDMIERSNQAFNQGADFLDNLKKLQSRRAADREFHVSEMINMERKIDANEIINLFLGGKGKKRSLAPLEAREVRRRDLFKDDFSKRLNLYEGIIENIKKFTGTPDIAKSVEIYGNAKNDGFQFYTYLNEMNQQIEYLTSNYLKLSTEILKSQDYNSQKLQYFDQRIDDLHKQLHDEINKTMELKDKRDSYELTITTYLDTIMEILKILNCDFSPQMKLLGDHTKVNVYNTHTFLSALEKRINEVLAYVYCIQRKNTSDILADDAKLAVKSLKRAPEELIKLENVITTQQCAECAEGEDVNRFDDKTVYPLDHETIKQIMRDKVEWIGMDFRLHNLSKCNLPRSGIIMGRRYAE